MLSVLLMVCGSATAESDLVHVLLCTALRTYFQEALFLVSIQDVFTLLVNQIVWVVNVQLKPTVVNT